MRCLTFFGIVVATFLAAFAERPNVVLIMTDDQGWAQTGYYNHPVLKTPNLDAMAASGLRFDRFYAGAPVCSPTRASVLTGRYCERPGVPSHGHGLRLQERSIATAMKRAGYGTGHFGKWHLNALRGPGVPLFKEDSHNPGAFGFETWVTVSNFFDMDPLMSRNGNWEEFSGSSSDIIVQEALDFIDRQIASEKSFFAVIWDGSPHVPFRASEADCAAFKDLNTSSMHHYGELVAVDRSIGTLRQGLRDRGVADNTLVWFTSDNGGLPKITPSSVGDLRGFKGSVYEGGLRVPGIVEWPAGIQPRITDYQAGAIDIFPTLVEVLDLPADSLLEPVDGLSLVPLFDKELERRPRPMGFRFLGAWAWLDNDYKLVQAKNESSPALYRVREDPGEKHNIAADQPERVAAMQQAFATWSAGVDASIAGADYPEGTVSDAEPVSGFWTADERYAPFFSEWRSRPEYAGVLNPKKKSKSKPKVKKGP